MIEIKVFKINIELDMAKPAFISYSLYLSTLIFTLKTGSSPFQYYHNQGTV